MNYSGTYAWQIPSGLPATVDAIEYMTLRNEAAMHNVNGGAPVFKGTRVPVKTLFEYLDNDYSVEEFLECFPSVSRELVQSSGTF